MEPFRYHVFICDQQKPEGVPCCSARGSAEAVEALRREIVSQGLLDVVQVTACGSLGLCEHGPNMVVYPEGIWYSGLTPADIPELVRLQFREGVVVERLARTETSDLRAEIIANREKHHAALRAKDTAGILPDELSTAIRGFQESRAILTAIELDAFSAVGPGSRASDLAGRIGTDPRATEMLLNALAAMRLLTKENGIFFLTPVSSRFLAAGGKDDSRAAIMHTAGLWARWSTLTDCVRAGTAVTHMELEQRGEQRTEAFIAAMDRNAHERAPHVLRAVGSEKIGRMLDVGGGSGAYSIAFARAIPGLRAEILDLPGVCPIAQRHIEMAGLTGRVVIRAADLRRDALGEGYDLILVSAICHMLSPDENLDLLRRCHAALRADGRVVIQDFILENDKTAPKFAALFALNMLVGTIAGSSYSVEEYRTWLSRAGFCRPNHVRLAGPTGLMIGTRKISDEPRK